METGNQKISPHLWFDREAVEASAFYTKVFSDSKVTQYSVIHDTPSGDCDIVGFQIRGFDFMSISAGPMFKKNPSISFFVNFDPSHDTNAKKNIDVVWTQLSKSGKVLMDLGEYPWSKRYGWVQDKYGVSWQIVPENMGELMARNPKKITPAMLSMKKIIIADLEKAGKS